jgi:peptide/nickel transport system substrate-binding protein
MSQHTDRDSTMPPTTRINRRGLMRLVAGTGASLALASLLEACGGSSPSPTNTPAASSATNAAAASGSAVSATSATTGGSPTTGNAGAVPPAQFVSATDGTPRKGGTLRIGFAPTEPPSLDPQNHSNTNTGNIIGMIYDSLLAQDPYTSQYIAGPLTESFAISQDQRTWTFHLKKGVTFQDGTPFNAQAVRKDYERALDPAAKSQVTGIYLPPKATFDTPDDYTFTITSPQPYGPMASHLFWDAFFGISSPTARAKSGADYDRHPVGAGPFTFKEWAAGDHITLQRNENYTWGAPFLKNKGPAYLDSVFIKIITETNTVVTGLQSGDIDVAYLPNQFYDDFAKDKNFQILTRPSGALSALGWNLDRWPFTDLPTRQALMYGFDRQRFLTVMEGGHGKLMYGTIVPALPFYWAGEQDEGQKYDLAKAKAMLKAAGWSDPNKDGFIEKDGKPFRVTLAAGGTDINVRWSSIVADQGKQLGIDVQIVTLETAALTARLNSGDYDLFQFGYDTVDPDILTFFFAKSQIPVNGSPGLNRSHLNDAKLEDLLTRQRTTLGDDRRQAVQDCVRYMMQQAFILPLYTPEKNTVVNKKVKGLIFYPDAADWELTDTWIQ